MLELTENQILAEELDNRHQFGLTLLIENWGVEIYPWWIALSGRIPL